MEILSSNLLANALRMEFADTYTKIRNRQSDSRLKLVMDEITATNRQHEFAYIEAGPHVELWRRGDTIPQDAMGSTKFTTLVWNWGRRIKWHRDDRADDQTQSMMDSARMTAESAALLNERMFFDLISGSTNTLPVVPNAPDGAAMFATTANGANRFGVSSGNLLTGTGVASTTTVLNDYYSVVNQFRLFQDGKGQPLLSPETIAQGILIVHAVADTKVMEQAFLQKLQGTIGSASGTPSNVVLDASRNIQLFGSPRLATGDWYAFLLEAPKKPTFALLRQDLTESSSLVGDNNSDSVRTTGEEYIQWDLRKGAGIALPYAAIKVDN